jgi:pentatricopeptide repeat protein
MGSDQKISQAFELLLVILSTQQKYAECEKLCKEVLDVEVGDDNRLKADVLRSLIRVLAKENQFEKAHDLIDKLIKSNPDNWLNVEVKGDLLRDQGKPGEAAKVYEGVLEKAKSDERLEKEGRDFYSTILRYKLSGVYIDANEVDKAAEHLKALLEKEPDNPTYNNDLGFIWADHDKNLAESEKLIRKALDEDRKQRRKDNADLKPAEDKDNPAFLDSLGWVLFKQKKYQEAKPYLEKAVEQEDGKHVEIYDHLGDLFMAMGNKADAVAAWKKGVEVAGTTNREKQRKVEVEKKLKANK